MEHITAKIFDIQRFSVDDGPGIRTTVFFKGCPLSCVWCHNPESHNIKSELMYNASLCISCRGCFSVCANGVHSFDENGMHKLKRSSCVACGSCSEICPSCALEVAGREVELTEILNTVMSDKAFYERSGGGVTLSGGEPLFQPKAAIELCRMAKESGLHVAIETCGFASDAVIREVANWVDLFLYDYKAPLNIHESLTGVPQKPILDNLSLLSELNKKVILRCPIIPNCNFTENHLSDIVALAKLYDNIIEIHLEPYHPLGISKLRQLGREIKYNNSDFLDPKLLTEKANELSCLCGKTVKVI